MYLENREIDHINLTVPNLEEAIEFYTKTLGFKLRDRYEGNGKKLVYLTNSDHVYELMENKENTGTVIDHIAYVSDDIEADYNHYKNINEELLLGEVGFVDFLFENGVYYFFISGNGKERIEFCQRKG